ncbi:hypothetical protein [Candidatus Aalborgicola defluviihabitans]|uniref:hypothetical protein n=1 Tax=Candidatus Aalborgicola defluviihabitans TaxID=3386187 RepID=UPI001DD838B8|nr:hypothetical protein [Burkholderiales bacterium]
MARPVHMVFEIDLFREWCMLWKFRRALDKTPAGMRALPLLGPTLLAVRPLKAGKHGCHHGCFSQGVSRVRDQTAGKSYAQAVPMW